MNGIPDIIVHDYYLLCAICLYNNIYCASCGFIIRVYAQQLSPKYTIKTHKKGPNKLYVLTRIERASFFKDGLLPVLLNYCMRLKNEKECFII